MEMKDFKDAEKIVSNIQEEKEFNSKLLEHLYTNGNNIVVNYFVPGIGQYPLDLSSPDKNLVREVLWKSSCDRIELLEKKLKRI